MLSERPVPLSPDYAQQMMDPLPVDQATPPLQEASVNRIQQRMHERQNAVEARLAKARNTPRPFGPDSVGQLYDEPENANPLPSESSTESAPINSRFPIFDPTKVSSRPQTSQTSQTTVSRPTPSVSRANASTRISLPAAYRNAVPLGSSAAPASTLPPVSTAAQPAIASDNRSRANSQAVVSPGFVLPSDTLSAPSPTQEGEIKPVWEVCNGTKTSPENVRDVLNFPLMATNAPEPPATRGVIRPLPIMFGPDESTPFLSIKQAAFPAPDDPVQPHEREHEMIVFRHSSNEELPIAHVGLVPPPPPTTSARGVQSIKSHICSITPVLANIQSLDAIVSTPLGQRLAAEDPHAQSEHAQKLAQAVLAKTAELEAAHVYWTKTGPSTGIYDINHPKFDKPLKVVVSGDFARSVFGASGQSGRRNTHSTTPQYRFGIADREVAVTIWAPEELYLQPTVEQSTSSPLGIVSSSHRPQPSLTLDTSSPTIKGPKFSFSNLAAVAGTPLTASAVAAPLVPGLVQAHAAIAPVVAATHRPLVCLNLTSGNLYVYANSVLPLLSKTRYIFDLSIASAFIVAAAEGRRGTDRGLLFAAPPKDDTISSSHTSMSSVFSARGRESADSSTEADEPKPKGFLGGFRSKFGGKKERDVELGTVHPHHYGAGGGTDIGTATGTGANSTTQLNGVNIPGPDQWASPLATTIGGIAGDLGMETREQRRARLWREHQEILDAQAESGKAPGWRTKRKAKAKAKEAKEAKHSWPTRFIVGSVVLFFKMILWVIKAIFKVVAMVFKKLAKKADE